MLKYYDREDVRWGALHEISPGAEAIRATISRWTFSYLSELPEALFLKPFVVRFGKPGSRVSHANADEIFLAHGSSWLTVAHEFAHLLDFRSRRRTKRRHDRIHRALTDMLCLDIARHDFDIATSPGLAYLTPLLNRRLGKPTK